jgi:hypothetical protein
MRYANYSKLEFVLPDNDLGFLGNTNTLPQAILFNRTVVNNAGIVSYPPRLSLSAGRWRAKVTLAVGGAVNGHLYLQDLMTKQEITRGVPFKSTAVATPDLQSIVAEFNFSCLNQLTHLALMISVASEGKLASKAQVAGTIEFWKVSNQLTAPTANTPTALGPLQSPNTWVTISGQRYYHLVAPMISNWSNDIEVKANVEQNAWRAFERSFGTDPSNAWVSSTVVTEANPHWLQVTFPVPTQVDAVILVDGYQNHPNKGHFIASDDEITWTTLFEFQTEAALSAWTQRAPWTVNNPRKYKHYRFVITRSSNPTNPNVTISELILLTKNNYLDNGKVKLDAEPLSSALTLGSSLSLVDNIAPIGSNVAAQVASFSAANNHVIFRVHSNFKLWRTGVNSAKTSIGLFKITRLEDKRDFTLEQLPLLDLDTGRWQQFTYALPAGTYRFEHTNSNRVDGEWFFESSPSNIVDGRVRTLVSKAMTVADTNNQLVTASSVSGDSAQYQPWNLFNYTDVAPGYGWVSHNTEYPTTANPQWVQIEFTDGPKTINGYYINSRGVDAGPGAFKLLGKNKIDAEWTTLHTVAVNKVFGHMQPIVYLNIGEFTFEQYRLEITDTTVANKPCGFRHWCLLLDTYN